MAMKTIARIRKEGGVKSILDLLEFILYSIACMECGKRLFCGGFCILLLGVWKEWRIEMRKSKLLSLWTLWFDDAHQPSSDDSWVTKLECHPGTRSVIGAIMVLLFAIALVACGEDGSGFAVQSSGDSSSSECEDCDDLSSSSAKSSSSSVTPQSSNSVIRVSSSSAKSSSSFAVSSSSVTLAMPCKTDSTDTCEYGELTDSRDGQIYKTVKIGDQWWMAENLNYETTRSYCYKDSVEYCSKYGRLYLWSAAMDSAGRWSENGKGCGYGVTCSPTYPVRGACPEGWHLPSRTEWENLFVAVGGSSNAGTVLKSTSVYSNTKPTDAYGFSALFPGIMRSNWVFEEVRRLVFFRSSTEYDAKRADAMTLNNVYKFGSLGAGHNSKNDDNKNFGYSVRCIKDAPE